MPIDFHDQKNQSTYASREASAKWIQTIAKHVRLQGKRVLDLGCGGGIYTKELAQSGAVYVTGMDFSAEMLDGAAENCRDIPNIAFAQGSALDTGLKDGQYDMLLERALIHHIKDLAACFREAHRVLKAGGTFIIQDRTPEDCSLAGSPSHIRGYFFEKYPKLLEHEIQRRHYSHDVIDALRQNGFRLITELSFWETRRSYEDFGQLRQDLLGRTGRSLLFELTDDELSELVDFIGQKLTGARPIHEQDRWSIWIAVKE
ncbi:class I SAM-dependent methyltransferase [Paenibacillus sabinae]|uniref:SAM-dependent methyltransferase n=1 Tax=Paenibacillus sabinae T27 TaxID=1268072 RepID=X5A3B9_9BACL|nr:class I SAM-dependent methyltransferase [Paenibacillus sabinae]AHV98304.1 SAM-dependent methyltransferase [Paenibacillus sabinae T27]